MRAAVETSSPLLESCGQEFDVSLPTEDIALECDPTRLAQVISNLLDNAAKYTERVGRIWLNVARQRSDLVIEVRDTGIGIPPEMLPRVFDMFVQAGQAKQRSRGGLGLGLRLAKRLVEMHGGSITARSEGPGKGSAFEVRLPAMMPGQRRRVRPVRRAKRLPNTSSLRIRSGRHSDSCASLAMLLGITGKRYSGCARRSRGPDLADQVHPEVVLLDIGLPKMNGYDAARTLRQRTWGRHLVLIARPADVRTRTGSARRRRVRPPLGTAGRSRFSPASSGFARGLASLNHADGPASLPAIC